MKTLKHFVFAITLLVGTTLFANNDPVINYKTSTTCEKFEDLKFEDVCPDIEEIGDFGFIDIEELELLSEEIKALGFEDEYSDYEEIGDFGFVDIEEMELLSEEMEALEFKLSKKTYSKVLK